MIRSPFRSGFFLHLAPALVYLLMVFYLGSVQRDPVPVSFEHKDKVVHFFAFFVMLIINRRALAFVWVNVSPRRVLLGALALTSLIGALLEVYQAALPHRSAEVFDWLADTLGAGLAVLALWLLGLGGDVRDRTV